MTPETPDLQAIVKRLDRLERQNRRMKQAGILLLVIVSAVLLIDLAAPKSRIVEAEKFVLRDSAGKPRGGLTVTEEGSALELYDTNQKLRVALGIPSGMPNLTLNDANETGRVMLAIAPSGSGLVLADRSGSFMAQLDVAEDGGTRLLLQDSQGFASSIGNVYSTSTKNNVTSAASVVLLGKDGKVIWHAP